MMRSNESAAAQHSCANNQPRTYDETAQVCFVDIRSIVDYAGFDLGGAGYGYFPYPASSFMIYETKWVYRGATTAMVGVAVLFLARRL
ncbi:hypothetical protein AB4Z52_01985 [Rhizobium sp. 2YAF20]|uniref:hypothetical protein n=1 Tax=Rhizobium sp. 2YAF20 TaxID=3233027 RepID=UPI003F9688A3